MAEQDILNTTSIEELFGDDTQKFAKEQEFGRRIYITAWAVEILAASLGLCIAFFMAYDAYNATSDAGGSQLINAILGALPFVLIAVIEPTKIPLASGLYKVRHFGWKILILVALIALTVVTFETIYTGLERQVTNTTAVVTEGKDEVRAFEDEITNLNKEKERIEKLSIAAETKALEDEIQKLKSSRQGEIKNERDGLKEASLKIEEEIKKLQDRKNEVLKPYSERISDQNEREEASQIRINNLREEISSIGSNGDNTNKEREASITATEKQIRTVEAYITSAEEKQIKKAQAIIGVTQDGKVGPNTDRNFENWRVKQNEKIEKLRGEITEAKENRKKENTLKIENKRAEISFEEKRLEEVRSKRIALIEEQGNLTEIKKIDVKVFEKQTQITNLNKESKSKEDANNKSFNEKIDTLEKRKSQVTTDINDQKGKILLIDNDITKINKDITKLKNQLRREAEKNQIYRFAKKYRSYRTKNMSEAEGKKDDILDVSEQDLFFVGSIWFGSIALICATVGTILALISNIMRDPEAFKEKQKMKKSTPVRRAIRLLILSIRKRLNKPRIKEVPIEVEKIIEIEKEVEKEVQVIKEVIKEVPVDRIVEVEKEVPVDKVAIKEVPVEVIRKELVHVPFYATEAGLVDATLALKNADVPINNIERKQDLIDVKAVTDVENDEKTSAKKSSTANKARSEIKKTSPTKRNAPVEKKSSRKSSVPKTRNSRKPKN